MVMLRSAADCGVMACDIRLRNGQVIHQVTCQVIHQVTCQVIWWQSKQHVRERVENE